MVEALEAHPELIKKYGLSKKAYAMLVRNWKERYLIDAAQFTPNELRVVLQDALGETNSEAPRKSAARIIVELCKEYDISMREAPEPQLIPLAQPAELIRRAVVAPDLLPLWMRLLRSYKVRPVLTERIDSEVMEYCWRKWVVVSDGLIDVEATISVMRTRREPHLDSGQRLMTLHEALGQPEPYRV
jgi:hypothetical protein